MEDGKFYKDKFFYIMLVLILGAYAYTTGAYAHTNTYAEKLVTAIVNNDRMRQQDNKEIEKDVQDKVDVINKDVAGKLEKLQEDMTSVKIELARIRR